MTCTKRALQDRLREAKRESRTEMELICEIWDTLDEVQRETAATWKLQWLRQKCAELKLFWDH